MESGGSLPAMADPIAELGEEQGPPQLHRQPQHWLTVPGEGLGSSPRDMESSTGQE